MKYIFEVNHPKHYYQFKYIINKIIESGNSVYIIAYKKDILLNLLDEEKIEYKVMGENKSGLFNKIINSIPVFFRYINYIRKIKPDIFVSKASFFSVIVAKIFNKPSIIFPDSEVVKLTNKIVAPLASKIVTPANFDLNYGELHIRIDGFYEECYLASSSFKPNEKIFKKYDIDKNIPFYILRFVAWSANHDVGQFGFSNEEKIQLVNTLDKYGRVFISAEYSNIPAELNKYLLKIKANDIHHVLYYASAYIGDSQTMATESALLGTPSFRYNSFVGENDMSNFIILENKLDLLRNHSTFISLLKDVENNVSNPRSKNKWLQKRNAYFASKSDINIQLYNIIREISSNG